MKYAKIPQEDAARLLRELGLLVKQAGFYGMKHVVTLSAVGSVYAELNQIMKACGQIEIALKDDRILINGAAEGLDEAAGKNLVDKMALYKVGGLLFTPPLDHHEFLQYVSLFGTPPQLLADQGGFEAVLLRSGLKSIRCVSVSYQRIKDDGSAAVSAPPMGAGADAKGMAVELQVPAQKARPARTGVLDLTDAFADSDADPSGANGLANLVPPAVAIGSSSAAALAAMLRQVAAALERDQDADPDAMQRPDVRGVLDQIDVLLSEMTMGSRMNINTFADQVERDSRVIDSIESAARKRGMGLALSRRELIQRFAELNQEVAQPLTVSSGVIGLLHSGKAGALNASQRELLKMAAESVSRVNQLFEYMRVLSGMPDSATPDLGIIGETYR